MRPLTRRSSAVSMMFDFASRSDDLNAFCPAATRPGRLLLRNATNANALLRVSSSVQVTLG